MSTRILITGGAGFIGAHLARRLSKEPSASITILDNLRRCRRETVEDLAPNVRFVEGDIRDSEAVRSAVLGADLIFHLAAQSSVMTAAADENYTLGTNIEGTKNVLRESADAGVTRVVFTSSREVYGDPERLPVNESSNIAPKNTYGRTKASGEDLCREFQSKGLDVAVLRLANVYGPGDSDRVLPLFLDAALDGRALTLFGGQQVIDFVWIETVVDALLQAGTGPLIEGPTNIGSGKGTTVAELAERVIAATGSRSPIKTLQARGIEVSRFIADVSKARLVFGIESPVDPLYKLAEMIKNVRAAAA